MATYRNPWHTPGKPQYGPAEYQTDAAPTLFRGFSIYRRESKCFDVVGADTCVGQYAGLSGAKGLIDLMRDNPADYWAERALKHIPDFVAEG